MSKMRRHEAAEGLHLLEQAILLLKQNPGALLHQLIGLVPFLLLLQESLHSWLRGGGTHESSSGQALLLALAFLWMKVWQASAARQMMSSLRAEPPVKRTWRQGLILALRSLPLHAAAFLLQPLALLAAGLPMGVTMFHFRNLSCLDDGKRGLGELQSLAWRLAQRKVVESHIAFLTIKFIGFIICINAIVLAFLLPDLLKSLFDIDTAFSRLPMMKLFLNGDFWTATLPVALLFAWSVIDTLLLACAALRCFDGVDHGNGEILLAQLRRRRLELRLPPLTSLLVLGWLCLAPSAEADENRRERLGSEMRRVSQGPEFTWRDETDLDVKMNDEYKSWMKAAWDWLMKKLFDQMASEKSGKSGGDGFWAALNLAKVLVILFVIAIIGLLIYALLRHQRLQRARAQALLAPSAAPIPDITHEDTRAEQLSGDRWIQLAREMEAKQEWRLAIRAWHFACLATLCEQGFINLAKHKTNRDYRRELQRRGHSRPGLEQDFSDNVRQLESIWYGGRLAAESDLPGFRDKAMRPSHGK